MANDIQIFSNPQFGEVESVEQKYVDIKSNGWVYALEYGEMIKIGRSANPSKRYAHLFHNGADYAGLTMGRFALSKSCVNFRLLETRLHRMFAFCRKDGTELFDVPFERVVEAFENLPYDTDFSTADALIERGAKELIELAKGLLNGRFKHVEHSDEALIDALLVMVNNQSVMIEKYADMLESQMALTEKSIKQTEYYKMLAESAKLYSNEQSIPDGLRKVVSSSTMS